MLYGGLDQNIDPVIITQKICSSIYSGITTTELDNLASQICMGMITDHPDFGVLGSRIAISNHQKNTDESLYDVVVKLRTNKDVHGNLAPLVSEEYADIVYKNMSTIQDMIDMERDYLIDFFGFKTLEKSYLLKITLGGNKKQKIVERPQHLFMRVAIGIHGTDFEKVKKTYDNLSLKRYTHATPTLFNASTPFPQLSSCYLLSTEDSVDGIFETITDCAKISKWSGGIGIHISNIRSNGSYIRKTAGYSDGIMPMLKVYNDTARYINQGGGKRNGSFAMYLEPHHADVFTFLDARKNVGSDEIRARDLFYALWVPDYFMECVEKNQDWYLMDPDACPRLNEVIGEEYKSLYKKYVEEGKYVRKIKSRELWEAIISSQIEHGMPYIGYKDHVNRKNNQQHYGTIKSSNLCVSGDTLIQVKISNKPDNIPIRNLLNQEVEVWNGKEWSKTVVKKTGENQKLLSVSFSNGSILKCTEYHKFYILENGEEKVYEAQELKTGMRIIPYIKWSEFSGLKTDVDDVCITNINECSEREDTYCFNEPLEHKGIFNGVITGQCIEINEYSDKEEQAVCNLSSICLSQMLESPYFGDIQKTMKWYSLLTTEEKQKYKYYEEGKLKMYTLPDCVYCKLLKGLLKDCNLEFEEIGEEEAEKLRIMSNPSLSVVKPFETVPQLFSVIGDEVEHLGGYDDNWKILKPKINYLHLRSLAYEMTQNLNKVIDINFYPTEKTRKSNMKHRPIGLGVQGLADVFFKLKLPFTSKESRQINKEIFETIYYGSMEASIDLAKEEGTYETYKGSPLSQGKFQYNLWGLKDADLSGMWDWGRLRNKLLKYGSRNSLNIALMPTASTASIFGNVESFEMITSNLYTRNVLSGVFTIVNKYLIKDLITIDMWNEDIKDRLIFDKGSVQNFKKMPKFLRDIYKTAFEEDQKILIKMSAERGVFVCQSQSLNLFFDKPSFQELTSCHFYGWKQGLKTGSYYIRTKSALTGQNFGLDANKEKKLKEEKVIEEDEGCLSCGA